MRGFQSSLVAVYNFTQIPSPFLGISSYSPDQPFVAVGMNENFQVIFLQKFCVSEYKNSFHYQHVSGFYDHVIARSGMGNKTVHRLLDTFSVFQHSYMLHQEFKIDGFRMVVVQHFPFLQRKMLIVMIIIILRKHIDAFRIQLLKNFIYYRSFSASGATCNTYYEHEIILYKYRIFEIGKRKIS